MEDTKIIGGDKIGYSDGVPFISSGNLVSPYEEKLVNKEAEKDSQKGEEQ